MAQSATEREKSRLLRRRFEALTASFAGSALCDAYAKKGADVAQTSVLPWIRLADVAELLPDTPLIDLVDNLKKIPYVRLSLRGHESMVKIVTTLPAKGVLSHDADIYGEMIHNLLTAARNSGVKSLHKVEQAERDVDTILKEHLAEFGPLSDADRILYNRVRDGIEKERSEAIAFLATVDEFQYQGSQA
jgi:hypothetical protein